MIYQNSTTSVKIYKKDYNLWSDLLISWSTLRIYDKLILGLLQFVYD